MFVNENKGVDDLAKRLERVHYKTCALYGGNKQEQRKYALASLKNGTTYILVATDAA